jgi:hypothetical protein
MRSTLIDENPCARAASITVRISWVAMTVAGSACQAAFTYDEAGTSALLPAGEHFMRALPAYMRGLHIP